MDPPPPQPTAVWGRQGHHPAVPGASRRHLPRQGNWGAAVLAGRTRRRTALRRHRRDRLGTKWVLLACRSDHERGRIILDIDHVAEPGGEAAIALTCIRRTAPLAPGAQAVVYDTALRGVHHQTLLRDLGLLPINQVAAARAGSKNPRRDKAEQRAEKTVIIETKTITRPDGTSETLALYSKGGVLGLARPDDQGELQFSPLERVRTHRRADKAGTYRWYNDYRLPTDLGGTAITVRLHGNDADAKRKLNRTENLRPIPPGDPDFADLFRTRNDAESINRNLDDTLFLRRAHSVGHRRQLVNSWATPSWSTRRLSSSTRSARADTAHSDHQT